MNNVFKRIYSGLLFEHLCLTSDLTMIIVEFELNHNVSSDVEYACSLWNCTVILFVVCSSYIISDSLVRRKNVDTLHFTNIKIYLSFLFSDTIIMVVKISKKSSQRYN